MRRIYVPAIAVAFVALLGACATTVPGDPAARGAGSSASTALDTVDVPTGLDTGQYPTTTSAPAALDSKSGWVVEGNRMADALIQVSEVDKRMSIGGVGLRSYPVIEGSQLSSRVPDATAAAFEAFNMKVGMTTTRGDDFDRPTIAMRIGLYRFGSIDDATKAFEMIKRSSIRNKQADVPLTGAMAKAASATEFKPGTVDSYRVEGPFVINISGTAATTEAAAKLVERGYELEVPKVQDFKGTPADRVTQLPNDVNGALARTLGSTVRNDYTAAIAIGVYGLNGLLHRIRNINDGSIYIKAGVDSVAQGDAVVYRTRDAGAANQLVADLAVVNGRTGTKVTAPQQLPQMICFDRKENINCAIAAGRWVTTAGGATLTQAQQRASAQYVILAKNP